MESVLCIIVYTEWKKAQRLLNKFQTRKVRKLEL